METILEQLNKDNILVEEQIDLLASFLMEEFPGEMGKDGKSEGAIEIAVRLLEEYKNARPLKEK